MVGFACSLRHQQAKVGSEGVVNGVAVQLGHAFPWTPAARVHLALALLRRQQQGAGANKGGDAAAASMTVVGGGGKRLKVSVSTKRKFLIKVGSEFGPTGIRLKYRRSTPHVRPLTLCFMMCLAFDHQGG